MGLRECSIELRGHEPSGSCSPLPTSHSGVCDPAEGAGGVPSPEPCAPAARGVRRREAGPGSQPGWKFPRTSTTAPPVPLAGLCAPVAPPAPSCGTRRVPNHRREPLGTGKLNPLPAARGQGWKCQCGNRSQLRMTSRTEGRCWTARDLIQLGPAPIKMRSRRVGRGEKQRNYLCVSISTKV